MSELKLPSYYGKLLDSVEKKEGLDGTIDQLKRLSSGLLTLDTILTGGLSSGWYGFSGTEQSAKSTLAMTLLGSSIKEQTPIIIYHDAEGSVDANYTTRICGVEALSDIFGTKSSKGGWLVPPKARYYDETTLEPVFMSMKRTLLSLPDKRFRADTKTWHFVFENTKHDKAIREAMGFKKWSAKLYSSTGKYWCETDDSSIQAFFVIDSMQGLSPSNVGDEEDAASQGMALAAREFAKWIPQVKGKLRGKHCTLVAINQIRENPGVRFGNPEYITGGNALKHANDVRCKLSPRAVPQGWDKGITSGGGTTTSYGSEKSIEGEGYDNYAYKFIQNEKNKRGVPFRSDMMRVWIKDSNNQGRGIDPVFDTFKYLEATGQATYGKRVAIQFAGDKKPVEYTWDDFKRIVLAETTKKKSLVAYCKDKLKLDTSKLNLRKRCFDQIAKNETWNLLKNQSSKEKVNVE